MDMAISAGRETPLARLTIRPMEPSEACVVSDLFAAVLGDLPYYNEAAKASELAKYSAAKLEVSVAADTGSVLLAEAAGNLAGFCFSHEDDGPIWLSWFGVAPAYRQFGVGTALLAALETQARERGAHKLWCDSRTDNEMSKRTLARCGFKQLCRIPNHWYRQDFILWEKSLG